MRDTDSHFYFGWYKAYDGPKRRFELLKRLQADYDIYRHFQFSGVPAPTDEDWHWWGKLSDQGGAVVVVRGTGGESERKILVSLSRSVLVTSLICVSSGQRVSRPA